MTTASERISSADWLGLAGRVCVVTGAGSGIGAETARLFAAAGASVAVVDRDADAAARVAAEIGTSSATGARSIGVQADVSRADAVAAAAARVANELGPCNVLVNNAAMRNRDLLTEITLDAWNQVLAVNLTGALICTQAFLPQLRTSGHGGAIVHVASIVGHNPQLTQNAYAVSKAGLIMLSRALSLELAPLGVRSNVVSPGFTRTPANEDSYSDPTILATRQRMIPAGRIGTPADLAQVIAFLASDRASYVNGQDIIVDGSFVNSLMMTVPKAKKKP